MQETIREARGEWKEFRGGINRAFTPRRANALAACGGKRHGRRMLRFWRTIFVVGLLMGGTASRADTGPVPPDEPEPKIEGFAVERARGGFLGVQIVDARFVVSFYDAEKKQVAPDVARAVLRWPVRYQPADERLVLNPSPDGQTLTSPRVIRPPHSFRLSILLFVEGSADALESYRVDFSP